MKSKVSLVESKDHYYSVKKSLDNIKDEIIEFLSKISSLIIKVNLVVSKTKGYPKGVELAVTPPLAVSSFIDFILPYYDKEIIIAERSAWGKTKEGFDLYGFTDLAEQNSQIKLLDLKEDEIIEKTITYPEGKLTLPFSKTMIETPFMISIVRPKTHCDVVMTGGIKNVLVGGINGSWECRLQIHKGKFVHNIMSSIAEIVYPDMVVIDGTFGMEGNGPIMGRKIRSNWVLASFDALAADSLAAHLMGFDIKDIGYLTLLKEKNRGFCYPNKKIKILGKSPNNYISSFKPHHSFNKQKNWR